MASASGGGRIRQVTRSNFSDALKRIRTHIENSDYVAVSVRPTGALTSSWLRALPIDTPEVAYLKSKISAESFGLLQFAVCPFTIRGRKVHAFPYNFHLFPRDELNSGMPSYSFSCQTSFLTSMAREGFDFNVCIYDGLSYISRVQESRAKGRNTVPQIHPTAFTSNPSVADSLFMGRIKSRVEHWRKACKDRGKENDGSLIKSLRKLILGVELYGSRPCLTIDVCSERQVQLALEVVNKIGDDLVPLVAPDKLGETKAVRVFLTSSDEDKDLLMSEIRTLEEEQNMKIRGFREVIDLISSSYKPIIAYNCLHDFTHIHSKFIAPLPPSLDEFMCSLKLAFANVLDVNHLSKEVGPLRKAKNLPATLSYLDRQFFAPIELEISHQADEENNEKKHGQNVLRITSLFAKLSNILKIDPDLQTAVGQQKKSIEDYANVFYPTCTSFQESEKEDAALLLEDVRRKISTSNLIFLWGFGKGVAAAELKRRLRGIHPVLSDDFELQMVDKTCAVLVFCTPGSAKTLLNDMRMENNSCDALREMMSEGLKGADYDAYKKVCRSSLWDADLADSLEAALATAQPGDDLSVTSDEDVSEIYWNSELMIDLNEL
ncbi:poly(A)-specific ribonuclease PARN-like [Iris pallida]|uniref:Poly(A)-specific ribonuclease PARN-like n=1 Tax=Iris pallida TaxID=29817 RepID=A0AAX6HK95_IRIPA|nr:poly(A)-specific ribonuclease PARN-like [Iris pallida]